MPALQGSVVASIEAQLHGYVVRETALSCQKCVSQRASPISNGNEAETNINKCVHECEMFT
jgi:hypothetical protein